MFNKLIVYTRPGKEKMIKDRSWSMIDELNVLSTNKIQVEQQIRSYFEEMPDINEEQVEERTDFAKKMYGLMMLFFALAGANNAMGNIQDIDYYITMLIRRYEDEVQDSFGDDLALASYISQFAQQMVNNTIGNIDEPYTLSSERAFTVAVNEASTVMGNADFQDAINTGKTHKKWITEKDNAVRDSHREVDEVEISIREYFHVGDSLMLYPHDAINGSAREVVNCRCHVEYLDKNEGSVEKQKMDLLTYPIANLFKDNRGVVNPNEIKKTFSKKFKKKKVPKDSPLWDNLVMKYKDTKEIGDVFLHEFGGKIYTIEYEGDYSYNVLNSRDRGNIHDTNGKT